MTRVIHIVSILLGALSCGGGGTDSGLPAPTEPVARVLVELDPPAVHLTWKDIADESSFLVERKDGAAPFAAVATIPFNITQFHDASVSKGVTYTYRIAGVDDEGTKGKFSAAVVAAIP